MTALEEKADVERQSNSADIDNTPRDSAAEGIANPTMEQHPQGDTQYNVTLKTWCVVIVSQVQASTIPASKRERSCIL